MCAAPIFGTLLLCSISIFIFLTNVGTSKSLELEGLIVSCNVAHVLPLNMTWNVQKGCIEHSGSRSNYHGNLESTYQRCTVYA